MKLTVLALALAGTTLVSSTTEALNEPTHRIVNQVAADTPPTFNSFLQTQLGLLRGIAERLKGEKVAEWLGEGGIREDDLFPTVRVFRHFHDPLEPWDSAGLLGLFDSSIRWMHRNDQDQGWSWQRARNFYWTALTTADPVAREQAWADTFRAAGQIMHLIVDASVPEHARNDLHALEFFCRSVGRRCYGNYEYWVSDQHGQPGSTAESAFIATYLSSPIGFDATILQQPTGDLQAPIPIARLITRTSTTAPTRMSRFSCPAHPAIGLASSPTRTFQRR
jgi:hypothetical protein